MMNLMQKGQTIILVLVGILVLAVIAGGTYYFGKSQSSKPQPPNPVVTSPTPQATPSDETADWKTYTGKVSYALSDLQKSGLSAPPVFSIKYPADWTSQTFSDDVGHLGFAENGKQYKARLNDSGRGLTPDPDLVREDIH